MNEYYVYEWYNVDTNEVFYVGKGKKDRYKHIKNRNKFFIDYYNTHNCDVRKVYINLTEEQAFEKEMDLISYYKNKTNFRLTNQTNGGEGMSGFVVSNEFREKIREIVSGTNNPNYGHYWTEEQKQKARERALSRNYKGKNNPNYGNKWTEEQRNKASLKRKNNPKYVKENHGRAKKWIVLETGHIETLKENIKKYISTLPKISTSYHFVEYSDNLLDKNERIKYLINILKECKIDIFIREDGVFIYGKKNLIKELPYGIKKLNSKLKKKENINSQNHTYYEINHSPFI